MQEEREPDLSVEKSLRETKQRKNKNRETTFVTQHGYMYLEIPRYNPSLLKSVEALKSNSVTKISDFTELKNAVLCAYLESGDKLKNWANWSKAHDGNKYSTYI